MLVQVIDRSPEKPTLLLGISYAELDNIKNNPSAGLNLKISEHNDLSDIGNILIYSGPDEDKMRDLMHRTLAAANQILASEQVLKTS